MHADLLHVATVVKEQAERRQAEEKYELQLEQDRLHLEQDKQEVTHSVT